LSPKERTLRFGQRGVVPKRKKRIQIEDLSRDLEEEKTRGVHSGGWEGKGTSVKNAWLRRRELAGRG